MKSKKKKNFEEGLIWNYGSIVILALSGILFDTLIICFYNAETLGIFNQAYAYYIIVSQLCAWGIHMSVVRAVSLSEEGEEQKKILSSAILLVLGISSVVCFIIKTILTVIESSDLIIAFGYVLPALFFFAENKVILGFFNGRLEMKIYAFLQSIRSISIALGILILALLHIHYTKITLCFLIGEFVVTLIGIGILVRNRMISREISFDRIKEHFYFGSKIFLSNLVLELNR